MDQDIQKKLAEQDAKLDAIYSSVEKTRKYFVAIFWVTIVAFVLPLLGLVFAIPSFLKMYSDVQGIL
jgi:hypothetical protein